MLKARNILIACLTCIFLCGPAALFAAEKVAHIDLPAWFTSEEAKYLSGGESNVNVRAELTPKGFESGGFQKALETEVGNFIPYKAAALLDNAAIQRAFISASNKVFGWECYPTYYDSDYLYLPSQQALSQMPSKREGNRNRLIRFGESLHEYAGFNPEVDFIVVIPDSSYTSPANPAHKLVSNAMSTDEVISVIATECKKTPNVLVVGKSYDDTDEYYQHYYKGDHHWNGAEASKIACDMFRRLDDDAADKAACKELSLNDLVFNGANARNGLMMVDALQESVYMPYSDMTIDGTLSAALLQENPIGCLYSAPKQAEFNFYARWYGGDSPVTIKNDSCDGSAVMINDSFGDSFRWFVAEGFGTTRQYMDIHFSSRGTSKLKEHLTASGKSDEPDAVIFVATISNYASLLERYPNYFDID